MVLNKDEIRKFLPHREPFLFVDSVESVKGCKGVYPNNELHTSKELVEGEIVAHYRTLESHPIFAGHFPGNPVLPGVVQVEMMAQVAGLISILSVEDLNKIDLQVALVSVKNAKFRQVVKPEMELRIEAVCIKSRAMMFEYDCKITHEGKVVSEATVMASAKI